MYLHIRTEKADNEKKKKKAPLQKEPKPSHQIYTSDPTASFRNVDSGILCKLA
jgi:hypothetical protein